LPPAHRALLGDPVEALREDIELAIHVQELDLYVRSGLLPGLSRKVSFEAAQASFRRADQILHRRIGLAHLGQRFLGGNAAVHQPDPPRLAVLPFDLG